MSRIIINYDNEEWAFELKAGSNIIGRSSRCAISIKDPNLSREHCEIVNSGDVCVVYDKGSRNGTIVNGEKIIEKRLKEGDKVVIGSTTIYFERKVPEVAEPAIGAVRQERSVEDKKDAQPIGEDLSYWAKGGMPHIVKAILILIVVAVIGGAVILFLLRRNDTVIISNLIADGGFEDVSGDGVPSRWQIGKPDYLLTTAQTVSSVIKTDSTTLKGGKYSLLLDKATSPKDFWVECVYTDFLSVGKVGQLNISLWAKSESPNILIAVKAVWYADKKGLPILEDISRPAKVSDWTEIRHQFPRPPNTMHCKISLVVFGRGGRVYFDDIIVQGRSNVVITDKGFKVGDYQPYFSNSSFYISLKGRVILSNGRLLLAGKDGIAQQILLREIVPSDESIRVIGSIVDPTTLDNIDCECEMRYTESSLRITYSLISQDIRQMDDVSILFNIPNTAEVRVYPNQSGPASQLSFRQEDIDTILEYMPQMMVNTTRVGNDMGVISSLGLLSRSAASDDKSVQRFDCGFTLSESVLSRITSVEALLKQSETDMQNSKYGEAYIIYKKLMQSVKDNAMLSDIGKKIDSIKSLARREWERIEGKIVEARISRSLEKCEDAREAIQHYIECFVEADLISTDVEQAYIDTVKLGEELGNYNPTDEKVDGLIRMARHYKSSGRNLLASAICELILRRYSGTTAEDEARQILAEIKK